MIIHLSGKGFEMPAPIKNIHGLYQSYEALGENLLLKYTNFGRYDVVLPFSSLPYASLP